MESRKSVRNLAESIRSLLGLKTHLTSTWADSVCNIIKDLRFEEPCNGSQARNLNLKTISSENKDNDDADISKIEDDLAALNADLNKLDLCRRQTLNNFLDLKGNIRVFCRIRPIIEGEKFGSLGPVVAADPSNVVLRLSENKTKHYSFDKVFHPHSTQAEVFSEVEPVIKSALDGYNACIFAYGQTGTGKTFTMEGKPDCPGIVPLAIEALFKQALDSSHSFVFTFSMLEIYMGNLRDLLVPQTMKSTDSVTQSLSIQKDPKGGIEIDNLVAIRVSDFNQATRLYGLGSGFRSTASTNSNETSSRSHCLTRISMTCFDAPGRRRETNKLWMIDLGGSERVLKTKAWGRRLDEGKAINLSLSALGDVISALQKRKSHVPYRNSKLTQVLTDSLGEDSKTLMIVHVSPKEEDLCETVCSLGFATRVRSIHLGHGESTEIKAKKEVAMAKLLQKMKQLEYESQDVRRDIKKLKARLEQITGTGPSSDEQHIEFQHLYDKFSQCREREKCIAVDATFSFPAQLPRFMRPTICSKRKSSKDQPATVQARKKESHRTRRKKPSSVRAESVTFPIKDISEYGSDCSVSRTSCLTDYETEYSNNASECDIKVIIFPEQKKSERILAPPKPHLSHKSSKEYENREANKIYSSKGLIVNNWLSLQKTEPANSCTQGNRRMVAIPPLLKKHSCAHQKNAGELYSNESHNNKFTNKEFKTEKLEKLVDIEVNQMPVKDVAVDQTQYSLDDPVIRELAATTTALDGKAMEGTQGLSECPEMKDGRCCSLIDDLYDGHIQKNYDVRKTKMIGQTTLNDVAKSMLESVTTKDRGCCDPSSISVSGSTVNRNEKPELEAENQSCSIEISNEEIAERMAAIDQKDQAETSTLDENVMENGNEMVDMCVSQNVEVSAKICLLEFKSRRALFTNLTATDQKDYMFSLVESEQRKCHTGILDLIGQKVQTICGSTLLGLGVQNIGLGHDFFNGLML